MTTKAEKRMKAAAARVRAAEAAVAAVRAMRRKLVRMPDYMCRATEHGTAMHALVMLEERLKVEAGWARTAFFEAVEELAAEVRR